MKKKFLGRVLTMLLVASMVFTLLPAPAIAAGNWWWNNDEYTEEAVPTATTDNYYKIVHLDCGRKYFTELEIREIINAMYLNGFNQLQLAFGNGGLRFILDDMTLKNAAGEVLYNSNDVVTAIQDGNDTYDRTYNYAPGEKEELTETEMDSIISYANEKGIEIVPLLNLPGHMEGILSSSKFSNFKLADETAYPYSLDLNNQNAIAFGEALLRRYVTYFASKGCRYFNFGADEYGLSIYNPYFEYVNRKVSYDSMLNFMNSCVGIITSEKTPDGTSLTARCFNDFVYYNKKAGVNKNIEVCYWSNQWSNAQFQDAETLVSQGYKLINTNQNWYYVPGQKTGYKYSTALAGINNYDTNHFRNIGGDGVEIKGASNIGAMFCVWCDDPAADLNMGEIEGLIAAMAKKNNFQTVPQPEPTEPTTKKINIAVGKTHTETIDGNYPGDRVTNPTGIATVTGKVIPGTTATPTLGDKYTLYGDSSISTATGVISDGSNNNFLKVSGEYLTNTTNIEEATKFTVKKTSTNKATIQVTDTNSYLKLMNTSGSTSSIMAVEESYEWEVGLGSDFCWYAGLNNYYYLAYYGENWTSNNNWAYAGHLYAVEPGTTSTTDKTKLTFTGLKPGDTEVTVGTTKYLIHVSEAQLSDNRICINYYITNHKVEDENGNTSRWVSAGEGNINSDKGVAIEDLIALTGTDTDTFTKKATKFYKATAQSGNNIQTDAGWTNKIAAGDNCAKLRYWNNTWSVCDASGLWHEVSGKTAEYNPDTQREASAYGKNDGYAAITAYYGQKTKVTDEITTYATDWGEDITTSQSNKDIKPLGDAYALLDFAVKYQTGDRTPTQFTNAKTIVYNAVGNDDYQYSQDGNTRIVKDLFVENTDGYEVYMITVTKCSEKLTTDARNLYALPAVTYAEENEKVVWVDKEADLGDFAPTDKHYPGYKEGGEPIVPAVYVAKSNAYLVTYYVRAVSKDQLQVNYIDLATGKQFYHYGINVLGTTTFSENIALNGDSWKGDLVNGTVKNDKNKNQTVSADLSTMPEIGAEYRHVAYTCDRIELSGDHKVLNLYYTFNNTVTFVADFGLPITINKGDLSKTLTNDGVEITEVKAAGVNHGAVKIDGDVVTYTPDKRFVADENGESFTLTYTGTNVQETGGKAGTVAYRVNILPASNVLYEENFLTQSDENGRKNWTESQFGTAQQQTQKLKEQQTFGFDTAYESVTSAQGYWTAEGLMTKADSTNSLTTNFYGNAIDVIGSCGPKTGIVMVSIKNATTGKPVKSVVIETTYTAGTIDQVPLAHIELSGNNANYTAVIRGYAPLDAAQQQSGSLMLAADYYGGSYDALAADLAEMGLSLSDVEFIRASGAAAKTASTRRAAQSYALETVAESRNSDNTVTIDGFRVYRSANNEAYAGITNEYQVTYSNILKVMNGQVITAYVDNKAVTNCEVSKYEEKGGPQNEIYLQNNQVIAFMLLDKDGNAAANQKIQISLSAVSGATQYNNTDISSTMEMYYTLTTDANGIVSITNTGNDLLAIGNVKVPAGCKTVAPDKIDTQELVRSINLALNAAPETPDEGFDPAISAKVTTTRFIRSKVVTLTVSASADVAVLEVNGVELRPTNSWLVKMGWSDTYTYILTEKVQKNEIKTYEIVGYRADGAASETIVVKSK